jgi:hypothetical protein
MIAPEVFSNARKAYVTIMKEIQYTWSRDKGPPLSIKDTVAKLFQSFPAIVAAKFEKILCTINLSLTFYTLTTKDNSKSLHIYLLNLCKKNHKKMQYR